MVIKLKPSIRKELYPSIFSFLIFSIIILAIYQSNIILQIIPIEILNSLGEYYKSKLTLVINILIGLILIYNLIVILVRIGYVKNTTYTINKDYISFNRVFIQERRVDIPLIEITNIDYNIGFFWDKIFGTGKILISTAGSSGADLVLDDIFNVKHTYEKINEKLKLSKSILTQESGEVNTILENTTKPTLQKRVKPQAGPATFISFFRQIFTYLIISFYFYTIYMTEDIMFLSNVLNNHLTIVIIIILIIISIETTIKYLSYKKKYYDFYNDKLEYYDGFFTLNKSTVPYERITNIDENRGIIDRILGLYQISIETAGSSTSEIKITYVKNGNKIVKELKEILKKNGRN